MEVDAQDPRPGESCPYALHRQGTRDEWGQAGVEKPPRVSKCGEGGGGGEERGGRLTEEVLRVKQLERVKH